MEQQNNHYTPKHKSAFDTFQKIRHITMGILFLAMAALMFFPHKLGVENMISFEPIMRYLFGGICAIYGVFRIYRGIKYSPF